ncbi:hypothetical protein [Yersinia rohdei]|uniref:hypothetical protein n=1 Tax=Yersinia rohdei TaxID=29485 RepID=UPI0025AA9CFD|nr:hypothetical protein [Yersinia rohdei]MDN0095504.1 hypothetical protein [Yersinia rohdei]
MKTNSINLSNADYIDNSMLMGGGSDGCDVFNNIKMEVLELFGELTYGKNSKIKTHINLLSNCYDLDVFIENLNRYLKENEHSNKQEKFIKLVTGAPNLVINKYYNLNEVDGRFHIFTSRKYENECGSSSGYDEGVINDGVRCKALYADDVSKQDKAKKKAIDDITNVIDSFLVKLFKVEMKFNFALELASFYDGTIYETDQILDQDMARLKHLRVGMIKSNNLSYLEEYLAQIKECSEKYDNEYYSYAGLLPNIYDEKLIHLQSEIIPDVLIFIKPAMVRILAKKDQVTEDKTIWRRIVDAIVKFLSPQLFNKIEEDKKKTWEILENFSKSIEYAKNNIDSDTYDCLSPKIHYLAGQLLDQCVPGQYPFDPLNILSPDRKVWLELQKEWSKPLEPKPTAS